MQEPPVNDTAALGWIPEGCDRHHLGNILHVLDGPLKGLPGLDDAWGGGGGGGALLPPDRGAVRRGEGGADLAGGQTGHVRHRLTHLLHLSPTLLTLHGPALLLQLGGALKHKPARKSA